MILRSTAANMSTNTSRLEKLESRIEAFQRSRLKAGKALKEIWNDELYQDRGYSNIETYSKERFGFGKSRTYQLIKYGRTVELLEEKELAVPNNEAQARPLYRFLGGQEEKVIQAWTLAVQRHGISGLTNKKAHQAVHDVLASEEELDDDEEDEVSETDLGLAVPRPAAEKLGLSGTDHRTRRVVPWEETAGELETIIGHTDPETEAPPNSSDEPTIGAKAWSPLRRPEGPERIHLNGEGEAVQFRPDDVQRLENASLAPHSTQRRHERSDTLACPQVDILSEDIPDALTEQVLTRSENDDWAPIFWSKSYQRWVDFDLPSNGWIGAYADRSSIEETAEVFEAADDTAMNWALYDVNGEDRKEGLPEADLSVFDWIVLDTPGGSGVQLPFGQLQTIRESAEAHGITLAVRDPFKTEVKATPDA